ncbi:MAG: PEP/pyruvate-binding domain-containing protein [Patescibacteria group bacterium]
MKIKLIEKLRHLSKADTAIAGGKGASLGEMMQAGISVPPGFVVLAAAFEKFLKETDLNIEIDAILRSVDHQKIHTIENASEKITNLLMRLEMPYDLAQKIQKSFKELDAKFVAVRSSATAEDSSEAAWAGQLESYLNTTKEDLLENIKKCWASLFTSRAIFYRFEKGLYRQKISVAVVVQKMVESEVSGVAFSVHPITQDKNQLIIEAGFGLGEAIVSGQITPDSYVVEKQPQRIIDKNAETQLRGFYRAKKHGNEWRNIPKEKGEKQVLSDKEILMLTKTILNIENHFGFPCDVEWAKEKNKFYILQSRPITTLKNKSINKPDILDYLKSQQWFFGVRADESLLFYSAKRNGYHKYIKREYGIEFAETLLFPLKNNYPVRVFNLRQAKKFHAISDKKILKNPQILKTFIKNDDSVYEKIKVEGLKLISTIKKDDLNESRLSFKRIMSLYEMASANFIIIFSLGLSLAKNKYELKNIKSIVKIHDVWRNSVAFKEEVVGENLFYFFRYLLKRKKIKLTPLLLMKYLTLNEIEAWLDKNLMDKEMIELVKTRKKQGFIYLNLRNGGREVIDDPKEITEIKKYFSKIKKESKKTNSGAITGQVVYASKKTIRGKVIVIKDKSELKNKSHLFKDKILVAIQTTPHYIPYLKKVKAIITDEGGLTCHAAIVAREFKIPCIVGTNTATEILKDDDLVEFDTKKGTTVRIKE